MKKEKKVDSTNVQKLEEGLEKEIKKQNQREKEEQKERPEWSWLND